MSGMPDSNFSTQPWLRLLGHCAASLSSGFWRPLTFCAIHQPCQPSVPSSGLLPPWLPPTWKTNSVLGSETCQAACLGRDGRAHYTESSHGCLEPKRICAPSTGSFISRWNLLNQTKSPPKISSSFLQLSRAFSVSPGRLEVLFCFLKTF